AKDHDRRHPDAVPKRAQPPYQVDARRSVRAVPNAVDTLRIRLARSTRLQPALPRPPLLRSRIARSVRNLSQLVRELRKCVRGAPDQGVYPKNVHAPCASVSLYILENTGPLN